MPLKLTRTVQQAIVVHPKDDPDKCLTIRVMDIVPNAVCLGLMGDGTYITITYIEPGDMMEFHVNIDDTDPSRGAEGSGSACYCEGLAGFSFPLFEE